MGTVESPLVSFLKELMRLHKRLPSQLAAELSTSHSTVHRWLMASCVPTPHSCQKLAKYSGVPLPKVLSLAGHLPHIVKQMPSELPEFREYARQKYPGELDEDLIAMIEELIERRRGRDY